MSLFAVILHSYIQAGKDADIEYANFNISSFPFFSRSTIKNLFIAFSKELKERFDCSTGDRISIELKDEQFKGWEGIAHHGSVNGTRFYTVFTCRIYPEKLAHELGQKSINRNKSLRDHLFTSYQHPEKFDRVKIISAQLEETTEIIHKSLQDMLERGEKLEDLVQKTQHLDEQSRIFVINTRKLNRCCVII